MELNKHSRKGIWSIKTEIENPENFKWSDYNQLYQDEIGCREIDQKL